MRSAFIAAQLGMIKAMLLEVRGLPNPAARQFASALKLAHDSGYVRMVIDEGKAIKPLLEGFLSSTRAAGESTIRVFAENILNRIRGGGAPSAITLSKPLNLGHFSKREREIIDCLRLRMSNKEIADTTSISKNTVKFHLKKIFGKLGIQRRSEVFDVISHLKHEP